MIGFMSFKLKNLWKYEFLELLSVSHFPPELTVGKFRQITLIFLNNHDEEIISWKLLTLIKTLKKRQIIVSATRAVAENKVSWDGLN